jgi:uncharacterized membrane protein
VIIERKISTSKERIGENNMPELSVVGFKKDMYRASQVLNKLREMNDDWEVDLHDAVAVYRDYNR